MSTNAVADPVEFAAKLANALADENHLWSNFPLWQEYMLGERDYHLHKMLSGIAVLAAGERIAYVTSTLTAKEPADDSSYEITVISERHVIRAHREAGQSGPTIRLTRRTDLCAIEVLNAPINTISVHEPAPASGPFTVNLDYPGYQIKLHTDRRGQARLAALIPPLVADLNA